MAALWAALACATTAPAGFGGDAARMFRHDALTYLLAPTQWRQREWTRLAVAVGAVGGVMLLDDEIRDLAEDVHCDSTRHLANVVRGGGDWLSWGGGIVVATYLGGLLSEREPLHETGFQLLEAAVFSSAVVAGVKVAAGRSRPDEDRGNTDYLPLRGGFDSGRSSFPSQHTSMAFALAAVSAERIGNGFRWVAYPLAGLVGLSRVHDDRHWASDVLAGAAIGTATGLWVARRHASEDKASRLHLLPWTPVGGLGLSLAGRF